MASVCESPVPPSASTAEEKPGSEANMEDARITENSPDKEATIDTSAEENHGLKGETGAQEELGGNEEEEEEEEDQEDGDEEECLEGDDALESGAYTQGHTCGLCEERYTEPRVLFCLHSYCTACLEKEVTASSLSATTAQERLTQALVPSRGTITCPACKQDTHLSSKGVEELPLDYIMMNMLDMAAIAEMQIVCTSCKAKEKAVARCSDCANFLCPNCVTAHQYMRCFENHKVVSFEELRGSEGVAIHKPIFCSMHDNETLKYFCNTCQVPICNECMVGEHTQPEHAYERIRSLEDKQKKELEAIVAEAKTKVHICNEASSNLENMLSDLQMQRDNARGLIEETFQSYRTFLEKRQEELVKELEEVHSSQELSIMELFHNVEKTIEKIEDGSAFTERVLKNGNAVEILLVKRQIMDQMLSLINNTPKPDLNVKIEFETDAEKFEEAVKNTFGCFKKQKVDKKETPATSLHSSFEGEGFTIPPAILEADPSILTPMSMGDLLPAIASMNLTTSLAGTNPSVSVPAAQHVGEIAGVSAHTIHSIANSLQNLPSVVGAGVSAGVGTERSSSRNSYSPAMSDSGISVDAASNSSGPGATGQGNQQVITAAALAKLGTVNVTNQVPLTGNVTVNGQVIPGLNMNNVVGLAQTMQPPMVGGAGTTPPGTAVRGAASGTPTPDQDISCFLSSLPPVVPPTSTAVGSSSRSQTPQQLTDIAGLLSQTSPNTVLNGLTTPGSAPVVPGSSSANPLAAIIGPQQPNTPGLSGVSPTSGVNTSAPGPGRSSGKMSAMQIRCKFGQLGPGKGQFNSPHGFCLGMDEDIVVADTNNHRIQVFEKTGEFKYQFGIPGREEGQLWYPRKVAVIRHSGKYVVCDRGNERSRMQIFTKNGHFIKKIAIRYIDIVAGLAITQQGHIVAVDSVSPTVFCIAETGDLIKWFDCSDYMREPSDIAISGKEYFVCDFKGHCVVVFNEDGQFMRRIGCENITNYPNGIDISDAGDVLIGDSHGNRFHVAVFQRDGSLIGEFECPYVKVSRCCGLKITSEGYVVTLAKNNHHVLVLNTLYIA